MSLLRRCSILAGLAGLATLALVPVPAQAEILAEHYDDRGRLVEAVTLYPSPAHRALLITTETGQSAREPEDREALRAWLESQGVEVTEIAPDLLAEGRALADTALGWVAQSNGYREAGLLVVIDSQLSPGADGVVLSRGGLADPAPLALAPLMEALDGSDARHVLVAFTAQIAESDAAWGRRALEGNRRADWLTRASLFDTARQALVPWSGDVRVLSHLVAALSQSPDFGAGAPEHSDPDGFVTARDLAAAGGAGLDLWSFGRNDRGGEFVLARHAVPEARFDGRPTAREAYAQARLALARGNSNALADFLRDGRETPWHEAAALQDLFLQSRLRKEEGARCDAALAVFPLDVLSLNAGVIGRLDAFDTARDLAATWLAAVGAATGLSPAEIGRIQIQCQAAERDPSTAPGRALRLAMIDPAGSAAALGLASRMRADWSEAPAAAVLAGLRLLADGPGPEGPASVLSALDAAAADGHGGAALIQALLAFDGTYKARATEAGLDWLTRASEQGVPVAEAVRAAVLLSAHRGPSAWRAGRAPDRDGAAAAVRLAEEAGITVDPELRLTGLEAAALAACDRQLSVIDTVRGLDPAALRDFAQLDALLNRPAEALAPTLAALPEAGIRSACASLPDAAEVSAEQRALRDQVSLRLAFLELAAGRAEAARGRLAEIQRPGADAALLNALLSPAPSRAAAFAAAAQAGSPLADLAMALAGAQSGRSEAAALARLAALGDRGAGIADAALAALRFQAAMTSPGSTGAQRAASDTALMSGLLRVLAAEKRGIPPQLGGADIARFSTRAPGMLGLSLAAVSAEHRRLLGADVPSRAGAVVLASSGAAIVPGDVLLEVAGVPLSDLASSQGTLFKAVLAAIFRGTGQVDVAVWRGSAGGRQAVSLPLPPHLAQLGLPAGLR